MRRTFVGMVVVCLILSALNYQPVRAADLYVDDTGTNAGNCQNSGSPCRTIQYAVNQAAASGDTIHVAAGTYRFTTNGEVPPIVISKSLTLVGAGSSTTIYNATTPSWNPKDGIQVTGSVVVNIRGFTVTGAGNVGIHYLNGASGTIEENDIYDNDKEGVRVAASFPGGSGNPSHPTIHDNEIYQNGCSDMYDGVRFLQGSYGTIDDNGIYNNCGDGIDIDDSDDAVITITDNYIHHNDDDGIDVDDSTVTVNDDNYIYHNDSDGIEAEDSALTVEDNEIYENDDDGIDGEDSDLTITDNGIYENGDVEEGDGLEIDDSVCTIESNYVDDNGDDGIDVDESSCTIRFNWSAKNGSDGIEMSYGGGELLLSPLADEQESDGEEEDDEEESGREVLQQNGEDEYIIVNNVIYDNDDDGIDMNGESEDARIIITNNTIAYNSGRESSDGIFHGGPASPEITNNIIVFNGDDGIDDRSADTTINTYNDVYGNDDDDYAGNATPGAGSISADPLFVGAEDLHLQACASPAINAGTNGAPEIPAIDYDEFPRIVCIADMGAYEVQADAGCPCPGAFRRPTSLPSLLPTAQNHISEAGGLLTQANDLLTQAQQKGADCGECEKLINEAKALLDQARASLTNPIYANNLAMAALDKLRQAIECLKALLG